MSRKTKIYISVFIIVVIIAILVIANSNYKSTTCSMIKIKIEYEDTNKVIVESDIQDTLNKSGIKIIGERIGNVDFEQINTIIRRNPWVSESRVNSDYYGNVNINIKQRRPVVRIFDIRKKSYILDSKGVALPVNTQKPLWLLVARGLITDSVNIGKAIALHDTITTEKQNSIPTIQKVLHVALEIQKDTFLNALIGEIYVVDGNHYTLIPSIGTQTIEMGGAVDTRDKLYRLKAFYLNAFSKYSMSKYRVFDIRYKKQVVGIKKQEKQEEKENED